MPRSSMAALIARARLLCSVASGAISDDAIQDMLDQHRIELRWVLLRPSPTFSTSGVHYLDYYTGQGVGFLEGDYILRDSGYNDITGSVALAEPIVGHFAFTTQPAGLSVHFTGKAYNLYLSCAEILEQHAATLKENFSFTGGSGQQFNRNEAFSMCMDLAARYRTMAQPEMGRMTSTDVVPEGMGQGPAVVYPTVSPSGW